MNRRDAIKNTALLGGSAAMSTTLLSLLQSCQTQDRLSWTPQFFNTQQAKLVSALVDTILPKTDTPGGLDVKVDMVMDLFYAKTLDEGSKEGVAAQLDAFNEQVKAEYGKFFHQLGGEQKKAVLQQEEANAPKLGYGVWGLGVGEQVDVGFYRNFKSVVVMAYCTSEEIGKNQLKYDPVPGPYQGCIPFKDVDGVWSL